MTPRLDETDKQILRALQRGRPRFPTRTSARQSACRTRRPRRVQRLIDTGVVRVVGVTDPIALGLPDHGDARRPRAKATPRASPTRSPPAKA